MLLLFSHTFPHSHNGGTFNMVNVITEHIKDVIYWSRRRRRYYCRYTNSKWEQRQHIWMQKLSSMGSGDWYNPRYMLTNTSSGVIIRIVSTTKMLIKCTGFQLKSEGREGTVIRFWTCRRRELWTLVEIWRQRGYSIIRFQTCSSR